MSLSKIVPPPFRLSLAHRLAIAIERLWYQPSSCSWLWVAILYPFSLIYRLGFYWKRDHTKVIPINGTTPIVVVGNMTVGGSGKTPMVLALAKALLQQGHRVGILAHGYQAKDRIPKALHEHHDVREVGDEAYLLYLLASRINREYPANPITVWIGRPRALAINAMLLARPDITVVLCDDGLQDFTLPRMAEILILPSAEQFSRLQNSPLLPAGPLRQPWDDFSLPSALSKYRLLAMPDMGQYHASKPFKAHAFTLHIGDVYPLSALHNAHQNIHDELVVIGKNCPIVLITSIAKAWRVADGLRARGVALSHIALPDHFPLSFATIAQLLLPSLSSDTLVLLTEKDAVKVLGDKDFADKALVDKLLPKIGVIGYHANINPSLVEALQSILVCQ